MTRYEAFLAAVKEMETAVAAIDQASALMRDARVDPQAGGYRHPNAHELANDAASLLDSLRATTCEDCALPLAACKCAWLAAPVKGGAL